MNAFINAINAALTAAHDYNEAIVKARECPEVKGKDADTVRAALLPIVAKKYDVPVIDGERKAKGTKVLDKTAAKYNTAKSALQRLTADIIGKVADKGEPPLSVPRHIAALAKQLADACEEYEQAKRLAATAIAEAFAK